MYRKIILLGLIVGICQAVRSREYEPSGVRYLYRDEATVDEDQDVVPSRGGRQLVYYKASRRTERVPSYQYSSDDNNPEADYSYSAARYQQQATTENYPYPKDIEQIIRNSRLRGVPLSKKPAVEQYLKEVTPTTKTTYIQKPTNYLRFNTQPQTVLKQQESDERNVKQSPFQYILQSDLQQSVPKHAVENQQSNGNYEISEASVKLLPKIPAPQPQIPHRNFNLVAYQNALLAHQKLLETDNQDDASRSSIYVSQNIPKKPTRTKIQKPKPQVEDNVDYYSQLPQYQKQTPVLPLPVKYQARLPYVKDDTNLIYQQQQQQLEEPTAYEEEPQQFYQPKLQRITKPIRPQTRRPQKYQTEQPEEREQPIYDYQAATVKQPKYQKEEIQYQQHPSQISSRQPSKYLPEQKPVRYQQVVDEEANSNPQEALLKYQAALQNERAIQYQRAKQSRYQEEKEQQPVRYQLQYPDENQQESLVRYRPAGRDPAVAYRQTLSNSNVRYYRNLGRPAQYSVEE